MSLVNGRRLNYRFEQHKVLSVIHRYKCLLGQFKLQMPSSVDLRSKCPPIENQGNEGSCSGHATAGAVEFLQLAEMAKGGPQCFGPAFERVSRQFIYYSERLLEGTTDSDDGATTLRDACMVGINVGVPRETLWPYSQDNMFTRPSDEAYAEAANHKIANFYGLSGHYQMQHCLFSGFPFMLGFQVYESFMTPEVASTGLMPMPQDGEQVVGGHAVLCVGYDDALQCFIIRNSWGEEWGLKGYFHMPYSFMDSQYCDDQYTIRLAATENP